MPNSNRNAHKEYLKKHIPGAMFWDLDEHSDKDSPFPHMLPNSDYWTRMLWSFGIKNDMIILLFMTLVMFIVHADYIFLLNTLDIKKFRYWMGV